MEIRLRVRLWVWEHTQWWWSAGLSPCVSAPPAARPSPSVVSVSSPDRPPVLWLSPVVGLPAAQPPGADVKKNKPVSPFNRFNTLIRADRIRKHEIRQNSPNLLVLALVILQGGQVGQVALQSLNTLLVLSLQLRLLLALLLQVADVFVSAADLQTQASVVRYYDPYVLGVTTTVSGKSHGGNMLPFKKPR